MLVLSNKKLKPIVFPQHNKSAVRSYGGHYEHIDMIRLQHTYEQMLDVATGMGLESKSISAIRRRLEECNDYVNRAIEKHRHRRRKDYIAIYK